MKALAVVFAALVAAAPQAFDAQRSTITVYVYKQGLFSFLADNHVIDAPISGGSFDPANDSVQVTVDAAKMRVLDPRLPADKRAQVQANMLGPQVLNVAAYPTITFRSTSIDRTDPTAWKVTGNLDLHGQTHPITVTVHTSGDGHFTGTAMIRQSAFGITPIRIAGGAVSVRDDVKVETEIFLFPSASRNPDRMRP